MTDDRSIERAARSWLEIGPTAAPERAVDAALLRIRSTPQERDLRIPWRLHEMFTPARLAAAALVGLLAIGGTYLLVSGPTPSTITPLPSPSATPTAVPTATATPTHSSAAVAPTPQGTPLPIPALSKSFTSPAGGYSLKYPTDWVITPGRGGGYPSGPGIADRIDRPSVFLRAFSIPIGASQTDAQWLESYCEQGIGNATFCQDAIPTWPAINIGSVTGRLSQDDLRMPGDPNTYFEAAVVVGHRGYVFAMEGMLDEAIFQTFLESVRFDPSAARDTGT